MGSSPGFGSTPCDLPRRTRKGTKNTKIFRAFRSFRAFRGHALFRLAFATAPPVPGLTSPQRVTRRLILQKARRHPCSLGSIGLRLLVGIRFQVLFHSPHRGSFHLSLTVLVRYRSSRVFSLGRWTSLLPTGLACPVVLRIGSPGVHPLSHTGLSPSMAGLSSTFLLEDGFLTPWRPRSAPHYRPATPILQRLRPLAQDGFGLFPFRSPLLGESRLISLPRGTKMFQFPRFPPSGLWIQPAVPGHSPRWVSPFGHPRINACWRLPEAYRSQPRPSSALDA